MGTPVPPPPVPGLDCEQCVAEPWSTTFTPFFVQITFSGLIKCARATHDPPNGSFMMVQDPLDVCRWFFYGTPYSMNVTLDSNTTEVGAWQTDDPDHQIYFQAQIAGCVEGVDNANHSCADPWASKEGRCDIDWG